MNDENEIENKDSLKDIDVIKKQSKTKDLFVSFESMIDWNIVSLFSIWVFLSMTFFCIFF